MDRIILAPLEGMTDSVFRQCYYRHFKGLDEAVTPFLPVPDSVVKVPRRSFRDVALPGESPVPEIPQLLLSSKESFLIAGRSLADAGYTEVNWNLGCPSKGVVNKGKGAGMMPYTEDILSLLDYILPLVPLKISLKIRLGMHHPSESEKLVDRLNDYPIKELICHPRLGSALYRGEPDLNGFSRIRDRCRLPLVYNGDILSIEDFLKLKKRFPSLSGWMIGRGILRNPFLPEQIRDWGNGHSDSCHRDFYPLKEERFRIFLADLYNAYKSGIPSVKHRTNWMKGILFLIIKGSAAENRIKAKLRDMGDEKDFFRLLDELFQ